MFETTDTYEDFEAAQAKTWDDMARSLLKKAIKLQVAQKRSLSVANPPPLHSNPAKIGTMPHARTFNLRDSVVIDPPGLADIKARMTVRVGELTTAPYGAILKAKGWLGIVDTHEKLKSAGAYG